MIAMLISMFNPFFNLFYPKAETFDYFTTLLIALTQYFYYKRLIVTIYESSYGIFYQDRFKPFIQTFLSITLAILLGKMFGACGIFGAIVLSELFTSTWIEPYMVHKYGFKQSQKAYWLEYFKNIIILAMCAFITYFVTNSLVLNALLTLVMNWVVTTISYFVLLSVVYPKNGKTIINWLFKKNKPVKIFSDYNNIK
jgi:hypothetical protein